MNFIKEYPNAIPDSIIDPIRSMFDQNLEHTKAGQIGSGKVDSAIKDSNDLNFLEYNRTPGELHPIEQYIFPKLSKCLDDALVDYCESYPMTEDLLYAKGEDQIRESLYSKFSFWPWSILLKKYQKGIQGFHKFHEDNGSGLPHSHRALVLMFYLNDVEEGGETEFALQKIKVKPEKGKLVIFPAYWTHLHKGHIPLSGDKYICNFWLLKGKSDVIPSIEGKWNHVDEMEKFKQK
tara:strand:+ start:1053 stop:1757 length:705 start_codon:yes stop_codon:yes gene_type:complete